MCFRPPQTKKAVKVCPNCKTENPITAEICSNCGEKLPEAQAQPVQPDSLAAVGPKPPLPATPSPATPPAPKVPPAPKPPSPKENSEE